VQRHHNQKHCVAQRDVGGKTRRCNLGPTSGTKCEAARGEAADVLGDLRKGKDPKKKSECLGVPKT
jgi:hypothetical protein